MHLSIEAEQDFLIATLLDHFSSYLEYHSIKTNYYATACISSFQTYSINQLHAINIAMIVYMRNDITFCSSHACSYK